MSDPAVDQEIDRLSDLAHKAAVEKVEALMDGLYLDQDELADFPDGIYEVESAAPFCGCTTCTVREALYAAWPHLKELAIYMVAEGVE